MAHRDPQHSANIRDTQEHDAYQPPPGLFESVRSALRGYRGLRRRARASSVTWWWMKIVEGLFWGGVVFVIGTLLVLFVSVMDGSEWLTRLGIGLVVAGVLVFVRYLAAPFTCRWIVTVPENWYYVLEDGDGYTLEYLEPGRLLVPWRWDAHVREHVNFSSVVVNEVIEDVLDSGALPVDIEASVVMFFNPADAESQTYATLRKMTAPEHFQAMIARTLRDIVRRHLNTLEAVQDQRPLRDVESLEAVIEEQLGGYAAMGLTPTSTRPVAVHVRAPQKVKEAYQSVWARAARVREESKTLLEIKELARDLGLPYEEAFQLFYLMQRDTPLGPSTSRRSTRMQDAGLPPVVVVQQTPDRTTPPPPVEPAAPVTEADTPEEPPEPDDTPRGPRLVEDPERAPDPFDVRRRRRDRRRSRRLDD